jgi:hypothetical protein
MIHTLSYQSEDLLKPNYFKVRSFINVSTDIIHLTVTHSHLIDLTTEDIYKKILSMDGKYRTEMNKWTDPAVKVRVIKQL